VSLARLWQQQGKKKQARKMSAEIYDWFTEGFETKDLQEARVLCLIESSKPCPNSSAAPSENPPVLRAAPFTKERNRGDLFIHNSL
jgi:hypothetical protein